MDTNPLNCGLNEQHCQQLNEVLATVEQARAYCAKCKAAGMDMSVREKVLTEQHKLATGIKREFFPNMP